MCLRTTGLGQRNGKDNLYYASLCHAIKEQCYTAEPLKHVIKMFRKGGKNMLFSLVMYI